MKRYAILVDAGYTLASAAELLTGTSSRSRVRCNYGDLIQQLIAQFDGGEEGELLRVYWYDANPEGTLTPEFAQIAELPQVKVRLGRLVPRAGGLVQKGVDSRLVRDLIVLAYNRSVTTAVLLTGDEDITEGVLEAQEQGVKVLGLAVPGENVSRRLCQELDGLTVLPQNFWESSIFVRNPGEFEGDRDGEGALLGGRQVGVERFLAGATSEDDRALRDQALEAGRTFAKAWKERANPREVSQLVASHNPNSYLVPAEIDRELLRVSEDTLGFLWEQPILKGAVRLGFWEGLLDDTSDKSLHLVKSA